MSQQKRKFAEIEEEDQTVTNTSMASYKVKEIEKEEALFIAAESGDHQKITELLSLGVSIEGENYELGLHPRSKNYHMTPLLVAAANGHFKCLQTLIDHGANVNAKDKFGGTAIHFVIENDNYPCLKALLEAGADCSVPIQIFSYERKALHVRGTTPLHLAAKCNKVKFIETLIQFGADCDAGDEKGHTSLYIATEAGFEECVLAILRKSHNLTSVSLPSFDTSETPLHHAVKHKMVESIKEMLHLGCDVNYFNKQGYSPLHVFIASRTDKCDIDMEILKLLVVDGYNTDINLINSDGQTPLDMSFFSIYWYPEFSSCLISYGAKSCAMTTESLLSYQLSMPLSDVLLKSLVNTMPQVRRLKSIFGTLLIEYPADLHSILAYKISGTTNNLFIEVIDSEVDNVVSKLGPSFVCKPVSKYVKYPLEQPYLDVVYECLLEKLNQMNNSEEPVNEYYKNYLCMIKKRLWYEKTASVPPTLQHCCRLSIRKRLGPSRLRHVRKLPVPEKLSSYLLFESVYNT